jgi:exodeoxyribonuclease VII small subunit
MVDTETQSLTFETAMAELEDLVQKMESGALTLEQSVAAYKRGAQLVTFCRDSLARIEQQVSVLEGDLLKPFEADPRTDA